MNKQENQKNIPNVDKLTEIFDYYKVNLNLRNQIFNSIAEHYNLKNGLSSAEKQRAEAASLESKYKENSLKLKLFSQKIGSLDFPSNLETKVNFYYLSSIIDKIRQALIPKYKFDLKINLPLEIDKEVIDKVDLQIVESTLKKHEDYIRNNYECDKIIGLDKYLALYKEALIAKACADIYEKKGYECQSLNGLMQKTKEEINKEIILNKENIKAQCKSIGKDYFMEIYMFKDFEFYLVNNHDSYLTSDIETFVNRLPDEMPYNIKSELTGIESKIRVNGLDNLYKDYEKEYFDWVDFLPTLSNEALSYPGLHHIVDRGEKFKFAIEEEINRRNLHGINQSPISDIKVSKGVNNSSFIICKINGETQLKEVLSKSDSEAYDLDQISKEDLAEKYYATQLYDREMEYSMKR